MLEFTCLRMRATRSSTVLSSACQDQAAACEGLDASTSATVQRVAGSDRDAEGISPCVCADAHEARQRVYERE